MTEQYRKQCVVIDYTNYRGERSERLIRPDLGSSDYSESEHHPVPQWVLNAWDLGKKAKRTFAMKDIHSWRPATEADFAALEAKAR